MAMLFTDDELTAKQLQSLNDDVLYLICLAAHHEDARTLELSGAGDMPPSILISFCSTCKRIREIGAQLMFRAATLTDCKTSLVRLPSIDPWLVFMERSSSFQQHMRILQVELFSILEQDAARLGNILSHTTKLKTLKIITPQSRETTQARLIPALKACKLPLVEVLVLSAGLEALVSQFNLTTSLEIRGEERYMSVVTEALEETTAGNKLASLRHLNLSQTSNWSPAFLVALSTNLPHLESLGTLRGGKPGYSFEALLRIPDLFLELKELTIAPLNQLVFEKYTVKQDKPFALGQKMEG